MKTKNKALSLIELLATLAILATLMGVSFSTYSQLKIESRRKEAQSELIRLKNNLEKQAIANNQDIITIANSYATTTASNPWKTPNGYYNIKVMNVIDGTNQTIPGYTLLATANPNGPQAKDTDCLAITLTVQAGQEDQKNPDNTDPTKSCWK